MKKEVTIKANTNDIWLLATALKLKNDFVGKGFVSFASFSSIMPQYFESYGTKEGQKKLHAWWNIRYKELQLNVDAEFVVAQVKEINSNVETVMEKLRHE
ncbi:hypothetical protein [Flagellimonas sp.]|uniref:hypothetical protein n=1 Tax=Flagellimonas sp. TaxID=2058762 RepID=UPI003F4A57D0